MINSPDTAMNPARYHGHNKKPPFFEGWYYKLISKDEQHRFAIIPGVFISRKKEDTHSFIQILNGTTGETHYFRFQLFEAARDEFDVRIDQNHFRGDSVRMNVDDHQGKIEADLQFGDLSPWPVTLTSPGVMGPFGWLSRMECNHGVLSFDHEITGYLTLNGETCDFTGGRGYMEKDWGRSFPAGYIWMQSNHFDEPGNCLTASIAVVPGLVEEFPGFIVGLVTSEGLYTFANYNGAKVETLNVEDSHVEWVLYNKEMKLAITANRADTGLLKGPQTTGMLMHVNETMKATVEVELSTIGYRSNLIYRGTGRNTGLEVAGNLEKLFKLLRL